MLTSQLALGLGLVLWYPMVSGGETPAGGAKGHPESFKTTLEAGKRERAFGHTGKAVELFLTAVTFAQTPEQRAEAYVAASGSQIRLFQYRAALDSADAAFKQALIAHNDTLAGAACSNRATIYLLFGSNHLASNASNQAVTLLKRSPRKDYLAKALLNDGDIAAKLGHLSTAREELEEAISLVRESKWQALEALAEDHLGQVLFDDRDFAGAANAYARAKDLEVSIQDRDDLAVTRQHLAELCYQQGKYEDALAYLNEANASRGAEFSAIPPYWSPQLRAEILMAMNRQSEALVSFRRAVRAANDWRRYALPGDRTSIQTAATLHTVYQGFVHLACQIAVERHDPVLARESLAVLAESRAATLREQMTSSLERQIELPPRYFELLNQLQSAEAKLDLGLDERQRDGLAESLLHTQNELADLENKAGIHRPHAAASTTNSPISVDSIQRSLSDDDLLLSFSLGEPNSFLWGVSRTRLELYRLPAASVISSHAATYFSAVQKSSALLPGETLSHDLIGQLDFALASKRHWLIVGDGALLDRVPFACLPIAIKKSDPELLITHHSLRLLPTEQVRKEHLSNNLNRFLGIADPIYNLADSRLRAGTKALALTQTPNEIALGRLIGSAAEVRSASISSGMPDVKLLTGSNASIAKLQSALATPPSVLHFAVHVITAASRSPSSLPADSALALSLTSSGVPELLTRETIAQLWVPGALVVLSGCTSQAGQIVPSAGLIGLGRAWLIAGASAVIVSAWPTSDDSGPFFLKFYSHLRAERESKAKLAEHVAAALQKTQIDMQQNGNSHTLWAGYSILSDE